MGCKLRRFSGTFVAAENSYDQDHTGNALDFQTLVDHYYEPLYRFAMSLTGSETDAADLVQDTFLTWANKGSQLRDRGKVKSWLFTTLHRRFLEIRRRIVRFPQLEIESVDQELPRIEPEMVRHLDGQGVVAALSEIDPQFHAAVALYYLEDYSYNEIAEVLEVPLGTVKSRIARGIAQLRERVLRRASNCPSSKEATP